MAASKTAPIDPIPGTLGGAQAINNAQSTPSNGVPDNITLGVDPEGTEEDEIEEIEEVEEVQEETTETPSKPENQATNTVQIASDEHKTLLKQAEYFQQILQDPVANQFLSNRFRELVQETFMPDQVPQDEVKNGQGSDELSQLRKEVAELTKGIKAMGADLSTLAVENFKLKHPDFDQHADTMRQIMNEIPNIPPEKAYEFAKLKKGGSPQQANRSRENPANPTSEAGNAGISSSNSLTQMAKSLMDRSKYPKDSYVRAAIDMARTIHKQK